ncbi:radiation-inducible immediate-early gene IEX-1 [Ahaetulla prasina]|uniref:radiation-inducible immediate-early gene IEX-1 n=1 Tax=Ahaetulla prasina TaxID=499056 RepID=UPI002647ECD1|nr:radiation-inducible immediate-early gene IEX-1 [Ahaetulla prasina]
MCYACKPTLPPLSMPQISRTAPTGPQYFTFDPLPEDEKNPAHRSHTKASKPKRRSRKVLYPPVVKRYYPTEERSYAKTLLFILLTIVFFQIYNAEDDLLLAGATLEDNASGCSLQGWESLIPPVPLEQPVIAEQPVVSTPSLEIATVANVSEWSWGEDRSSESALDITHFLQQNPAAF